jgi:hypothetical protein
MGYMDCGCEEKAGLPECVDGHPVSPGDDGLLCFGKSVKILLAHPWKEQFVGGRKESEYVSFHDRAVLVVSN